MEKDNWLNKNKTLVIIGVVALIIISAYFLFNFKQPVYVCSDGKQVSNSKDCLNGVINKQSSQGDLDVEGQKYTAEETYTPELQSKLEYSCKDVGKYITQEQKWDKGQPLTVILTKVCKTNLGDSLRLRIYWKIKNEGTKEISIHPHQQTYVLANSRQYDSDFIDYDERSKDDFSIGDSTGGELKPGIIAEGGVNVDDVLLSAKNITIGLEVVWYDDFQFKNIEI